MKAIVEEGCISCGERRERPIILSWKNKKENRKEVFFIQDCHRLYGRTDQGGFF